MSNFLQKLALNPGAKVKLRDIPTRPHRKFVSSKDAPAETAKYLEKLDRLQNLMYAEGRHSLLIVLQGLDGAGKDGVIRHVLSGMNPQGCDVTAFKQPTPEEAGHDFLWRVHPHAPRKGMVAVFNRSHYEDVLVVRVHGLIDEKECERRFELIRDFERLLRVENQTTVLKFFLHISKEEQLLRFKQRLEDPARNWKISESDYQEREYWDKYQKAYETCLRETGAPHAPWFVIPSDDKWFRNLAVSQIIAKTMEALRMRPPAPKVDLAKMRRKYLKAEREE